MPYTNDSIDENMQQKGKAASQGSEMAQSRLQDGDFTSPQSTKPTGLQLTLLDHDVRGEKSIAKAQAGICVFILALFFGAQYSGSMQTLNVWVPAILTGLIITSLLRFQIASKAPFYKWTFELINIIDIAIYLSLIWSYQFSYDMSAGSVLKAPSLMFLFVLIGLRALRFHSTPIIITGVTAVAGWGLIVWLSVLKEGEHSITHSYAAFMTSESILIGAEVEKMTALGALTFFLAIATQKARKNLSQAADVKEYEKALGSAQEQQEIANLAQENAVKARQDLDDQDKKLTERNRLFNIALDKMSKGICMFDKNKRLLVCNDVYIEMYALSPDLARPGTPYSDLIEHRIESGVLSSDEPEGYFQERLSMAEERSGSTNTQTLGDGRIIVISHQPMEDGGWVATHEDVTDRRRVEAEVVHLANHDALTGLPNRIMLRAQIDDVLQHLCEGEDVAVMSLDIDRFKVVNDTLGHPVGDALLKMVSKRLRSCVRESETIARLGSDEFGIVQVGMNQPEDASKLANRICEVIKRPFDINGQQVIVGACIGISIAPADGEDPDLLLKNADMALYSAKCQGSGTFNFFETGMVSDLNTRREMETGLRIALDQGQFELHYQPLQNLESGEISGLEALLRWRHPERGFISPVEFIPVAEEIGLIIPLGEWVIRQACADASLWPENTKIAVNVSPVQFRKGNIVSMVMSALSASHIDPRRLEIEITESVLLNNSDSTLDILHQLRGMGVRIAMDDFGTGYSSLSYLRSFPFDKIKIDGMFIHDLTNSEDALVIVRAVASLGKSLGMTTTAECVETVEQRDAVAEEGYDEIQGYFFSPPRPAEEISERFFKENKQALPNEHTGAPLPDLNTKSA